jgi:hypothetical protein
MILQMELKLVMVVEVEEEVLEPMMKYDIPWTGRS